MTSYGNQSIEDIKKDIKFWLQYTKDTKKFLEENIQILKENKYWANIPFNFKTTLYQGIKSQNTNMNDLDLILNAILKDKISKREVDLMNTIGENAFNLNGEFGQTYKEDIGWHKYGDANFSIVEKLYAKGRDYFVTLQDASNISKRLNDYISTNPSTVNQNITQTINGSSNIIAGVNYGSINKKEINSNDFLNEVDSLLSQLHDIYDVDVNLKKYFEDTLKESKEVVSSGDSTAQINNKTKMQSFLIGAGQKASRLVNLIGSYTSIASYFDF